MKSERLNYILPEKESPPAVLCVGDGPMVASDAILMADNRMPVVVQPRAGTLTYPALAFALNALYACTHGYDLLYYRMVSPECKHAVQGTRHASYCKLP